MRRAPEKTVLHVVVREHLETFLATFRAQHGKSLPRYVEQELRRYLRCGVLAHGFLRISCSSCRQEMLVAFSCKCRASCPSCGARRACAAAAHLVDIIFNFLNLHAGWIHRIDSGHVARPYRAPNWLLGLGTVFAFVNAAFMGAGAKVYHPWALWAGLVMATLIIPVFCYRHYVQDGGKFPHEMAEDLSTGTTEKKAGVLPYLTLVAGIAVVLITNAYFRI